MLWLGRRWTWAPPGRCRPSPSTKTSARSDHRPVSREQAEALADRLWLERVVEQAEWQGETDPERLTRAFTAPWVAAITGRETFGCCRDCGQS
ncbi:hypothetical protein GCM10010521_72130 [Streptomyces rameus]|uniref:DUF6891 domain-containing protein n=1 Tax=Streptomyces rameus TaxID=68261 RepID=A0ABN3V838_9ACTN